MREYCRLNVLQFLEQLSCCLYEAFLCSLRHMQTELMRFMADTTRTSAWAYRYFIKLISKAMDSIDKD